MSSPLTSYDDGSDYEMDTVEVRGTPDAPSYGGLSGAPRAAAERMVEAGADYTQGDDYVSRLQAAANRKRDALIAARNQLAASKRAEAMAWLAFSAGMGAPTKSGSFFENFSQANQNLIPQLQNLDERDQLRAKYDQQIAGMGGEAGEAVDPDTASAMLRLLQIKGNNAVRALPQLAKGPGAGSGYGAPVTLPDGTTMYRGLPMAYNEWLAFQRMPPAEQERYLTLKRANQIENVNGVPTRISPLPGGGGTPLTTPEAQGAGKGIVAAGEAAGETRGKAQAQAQLDLPRARQDLDSMTSHIDTLLGGKGLDMIYGPVVGRTELLPGPGADALGQLNQILGEVFNQVYPTLKGAGAITEQETKAAVAAKTRAQDRRISPKEARKALGELRKAMVDGLAKLEQRAAGASAAPAPASGGTAAAPAPAPAPALNTADLLKTYGRKKP